MLNRVHADVCDSICAYRQVDVCEYYSEESEGGRGKGAISLGSSVGKLIEEEISERGGVGEKTRKVERQRIL